MTDRHRLGKPFPLFRYYLLYGGVGAAIFYLLLFFSFIQAERQALHEQYIRHLTEKTISLYQDIERDFLVPNQLSFADLALDRGSLRKQFDAELDAIVLNDFSLAKVKMFTADGIVIYDHERPENEGLPYASIGEPLFQGALQGRTAATLEVDGNSRFMEVCLPIVAPGSNRVLGILELYEDVTRFEAEVYRALKQALLVPTIIFLLFNLVLCLLVIKADRIISADTELLHSIRRNMEKYLSSSTIEAIWTAVTGKLPLFTGHRQSLVVWFSDIRGFTSFAEQHEPEMVVAELNRILELQAEIIHEYGGIIDKFVGDEVMATFAGNRADSAVGAALAVMAAIHGKTDLLFQVGIGIHAGEAVVGSIGSDARRDYTAIGDTINTGARLCGAASPGEIIISEEVMGQLPHEVAGVFHQRPAASLKGKAATISTYSHSHRAEESRPREA